MNLRRREIRRHGCPFAPSATAILGFQPVASTPEEFTAQANVEFGKWAKVFRAFPIKSQ